MIVAAKQSEAGAELSSYIDETVSSIQAFASGHAFRVFQVAARPPVDAKVPFAHGLPTLLRFWMGHDSIKDARKMIHLPSGSRREMDRYLEAVLARSELKEAYDVTQL